MVRHWTTKPVIISCIRLSPTGGNFFLLLLNPLNTTMPFLPTLYKLWKTRTLRFRTKQVKILFKVIINLKRQCRDNLIKLTASKIVVWPVLTSADVRQIHEDSFEFKNIIFQKQQTTAEIPSLITQKVSGATPPIPKWGGTSVIYRHARESITG